eukprot:TRINITY_DN8998_c0_g1_i1.p1 TRINITY_DN8998_c0_g1~~TRINITY_DN8998_c0_g1_i1.p1  ORF type:complete len:473 (-),score=151.97 TRINITY_DN8998_c0_g1_i1:12-1373(-)
MPVRFDDLEFDEEYMEEQMEGVVPQFQFEGKPLVDDPFDMANYDNEPDNPIFTNNDEEFENNADDPYITDHDAYKEDEDIQILSTDMLLIAAVSEDEEVSHLDFYIYQEEEDNLYPHHDYLLPSFPLCVEWCDFIPGMEVNEEDRGSMVAVGTFEPFIEIWDLDIIDQPEPTAILGAAVEDDDTKDVKQMAMESFAHKDAVLCLAWNKFYRNILASGSGDCSIKIWDLSNFTCLATFTVHADKVQSIAWNPSQATILATGGFDKKVNVFDIRNPSSLISTTLMGEIECLAWLPAPFSNYLLVSDDLGYVYCYDILKKFEEHLWYLQAHSKPTQCIAVNPLISGFIATGSPDSDAGIKLWDISSGQPVCIHSQAEVGPVFSLNFSEDDPFYLAIGARGERPTLLNTKSIQAVQERFGSAELTQPETINTPAEPLVINTPPEPSSQKKRRRKKKQ